MWKISSQKQHLNTDKQHDEKIMHENTHRDSIKSARK
jgi:hypothetical protein